MRHRFVAVAGLPVMAAVLLSTAFSAVAQNPKVPAKAHGLRRMADGHPDLQGTYDVATLTPLERPSGAKLSLTKEEAAKLESGAAQRRAQGDQALKGDRPAPPKGGDGSVGAAGNVGGYNSGWLDPGSTYNVVDGEKRSGMVIDPPDGRVPPVTPGAAQRVRAARAR